MTLTFLVFSLIFNVLITWYTVRLLRKLFFISESLGDLFLIFKAYYGFANSLFNMDMFYGEPIIEELVKKTRLVMNELETYRDVFEYTLNTEEEEELDQVIEEAKEEA